MKRRLAIIAFSVTALLLLATVSLWIASRFDAFELEFWTPVGHHDVTLFDGRLSLTWTIRGNNRRALDWNPLIVADLREIQPSSRIHDTWIPGVRAFLHPQSSTVELRLYWPTLLLALAAIAQYRFLLRPRRQLGMLCPNCNYDLRATPQRCPECGFAPPETPAPRGEP